MPFCWTNLIKLNRLSYNKPLSGILSSSGYFPHLGSGSSLQKKIEKGGNKETSILCLHGEEDQKIPCSFAVQSYQKLKDEGYSLETFTSEGANHELTEFQVKTISTFFGNYDIDSFIDHPRK
eukprot:TRINITY_DN2638_c0_g1_i3.p1 TRINITY_DN2638_c0_g1~~TRINITY_DN2638_c0_g1_i3.p1  ORF type:complete len:122 (-),score=19.76 TRINITY_DN2638_c0_g1_i3:21-386(-)